MAGRSGSPGDQYVRPYPGGHQPGRHSSQPSAGHGQGYPPARPGATLFGPPPTRTPQAPHGSPPGRGPSPRRSRLIDYPRANRTGVLRWIPSWKLVTSTGIITAIVVIVALLAAYAATPVPPIQSDTTAQTTKVFYRDGSLLTKFSVQNRTIVPIKDMSDDIKWATIAAEDRTFYANKGVSPIGIVRAAWNNARGRDMQGGSTITQQYVKNTRINNARTWQRKIKEFFIAIKINNEESKDDILANYLNTIYFGRNTYGIEAAAQSYFRTPAKKLDLAQSAYLAGIINGPELYDVKNSDNTVDEEATARAKLRYQHVLEGLVELGRISQAQSDEAVAGFETKVVARVKPVTPQDRKEDDQTIYLEQMVRAELTTICQKYLEGCKSFIDIARGGYTVRTTFDRKLIEEAKKAVHDPEIGIGPRKKWPKGTEVGLVSVEPRTGAVRAIYGGNGTRFQNAATQDRPQAGSVYKPFTLLAALEGKSLNGSDGIGLRSRFSGRSPFRYDSEYVNSGSNKVTNFGGEQFGMIDLITATEHSVNTVYAQLNQELGGGSRTRSAAERAGLKPDEIGGEVSNTLGNGNPTAADMATAYGTIAAQGTYHPRYVIDSVQSPQGGGLEYQHDVDKEADRAFSKDVTADATYAMRKVITNGTGVYAKSLKQPAAGKTGTVGGNGRETMAAWFVGFTPQLSTAVVIHRVGAKNKADVVKGWGTFAGRDMQGGMFPVRVWTSFMKRALDGKPVEEFPEPAWVGEVVNPAPPEPSPNMSPSESPGGDDGNGDQNDGQNGDDDGNSGQDNGQNGDQNGDNNGQDGQDNGQNGDQNGDNGNNGQNGQNDNQNGDQSTGTSQ